MQKKNKKYVKRTLYDRMIYYLDKACEKNSTEYQQDFAIGYMQGVDNIRDFSNYKNMASRKGFKDGYSRGSKARDISKRVKF